MVVDGNKCFFVFLCFFFFGASRKTFWHRWKNSKVQENVGLNSRWSLQHGLAGELLNLVAISVHLKAFSYLFCVGQPPGIFSYLPTILSFLDTNVNTTPLYLKTWVNRKWAELKLMSSIHFKNYPNFKVCFMYERSFYLPLLISVSAESRKNSLEAFFQFYSVWRYYLYEFSANRQTSVPHHTRNFQRVEWQLFPICSCTLYQYFETKTARFSIDSSFLVYTLTSRFVMKEGKLHYLEWFGWQD